MNRSKIHKALFREQMRDRRDWPRGSPDWEYRTRAATKYYWLYIGKPPNQWNMEKMK